MFVENSLLYLQFFVGATTAIITILAAAMSELRGVNQELRSEKRRLESILNSIGDGVVVVDTEGKVLMLNRVAESMIGVKAAEVQGLLYSDIVMARDEKGAPLSLENDPLWQVLHSTTPASFSETHYLLPKGGLRFPVTLTVASIFLSGRIIGAIKVFRDITKEKEIDRAKIESVSLASHQLWAPLASNRWYAEALLHGENETLSPKQREYFTEIRRNNEHMIDLVTSLLNVSRIELGTFSITAGSVDLKSLLESVVHDLAFQIEAKKMRVTIEGGGNAAISNMPGDERLLQMVFQNLISNALKYSSPERKVTITIRHDAAGFVIAVQDEGYGIPKEEQDKIFTKLYRASNVKELSHTGSGLGLYVVKSIIEASGGSISFTSELGKGTTFVVTFPESGMRRRRGDTELYFGKH